MIGYSQIRIQLKAYRDNYGILFAMFTGREFHLVTTILKKEESVNYDTFSRRGIIF
jgi:hypothetical protein